MARATPSALERTVERVIARVPTGAAREIGGRRLEDLAAMCGEFAADTVEEVIIAIARFFGERPPREEARGVEYAVGAMITAFEPLAA